MSTTEPVEVIAEPWDEFDAPPSVVRSLRGTAPIVPKDSIAGRSLTAVVAIMTFLASLTTGVAMMVVSAASDWQSEVSREVTIQVRPVPGRNIDADVRAASDIARAMPGIADIRAFTKEESARLVFERRIPAKELISHRFALEEIADALDLAARPADDTLKVVIVNS